MSLWSEYMKEKKMEVIEKVPYDLLKSKFDNEVMLEASLHVLEFESIYKALDAVIVTYRLKDFKI